MTYAGGKTPLDLMFKAWPAPVAEFSVTARAEKEEGLKEQECFFCSAARWIGAEVAGAVFFYPSHQLEAGERGMLCINADAEIILIIP